MQQVTVCDREIISSGKETGESLTLITKLRSLGIRAVTSCRISQYTLDKHGHRLVDFTYSAEGKV